MSPRLAAIAQRHRTARLRDTLFAVAATLAAVLSLSAVEVAVATRSTGSRSHDLLAQVHELGVRVSQPIRLEHSAASGPGPSSDIRSSARLTHDPCFEIGDAPPFLDPHRVALP